LTLLAILAAVQLAAQIPDDWVWTLKDFMHSARSNFTAGVIDDKIYIMAGIMDNSYPDSTVEVYDLLAGGDWATPLFDAYSFDPYNGFRKLETTLPELKAVCASAVVGDNLFAIGGALLPFINPGLPGQPVSRTNLSLSPLLKAREVALDESATLMQNAPNPFSGQTSIRYTLPHSGQVSLQVYDLNGRLAATLVNGLQGPGAHTVIWDAAGASPGVYLYQMRTAEGGVVRKCVVTP